jgi:hypothetical protein
MLSTCETYVGEKGEKSVRRERENAESHEPKMEKGII